MRFWQRVVAAVMLITSGCSYTFTIGPGERSLGGSAATCTTSRVPPTVDAVIAIASALGAAAAMYACHESGPGDDDQACIRAVLMTPPAVASAVIFGLSARGGYRDTAACETHREAALSAR